MSEIITYTTFDGVKIVGDWSPAPTTVGVAILLHMMPMDRKSWAPFAQVLLKYNIATLAIDMRGHGDSVSTTEGDKLNFKNFTDTQHQQKLNDAIGALDWLRGKGYALNRVVIVGASIGADLALMMLENEPALAGAVMLSPGNYRGMIPAEIVEDVLPHHSLWAAGSDSDDPEAYETAKAVIEKAASNRKFFMPYKNAGHGIHLFKGDPKLMESLAAWMKETLQMP